MNPQDPNYNTPGNQPNNSGNQSPGSVYNADIQPNNSGGYDVVPPPSQATRAPGSRNGHNPYEFIIKPKVTPASKWLTLSPVIRRAILASIGLVGLLIIGVIAASLFTPKDSFTPRMISLAQEQQEIIRVSAEVTKRTDSLEVKNYAMNINMTLTTEQKDTLAYLTDSKIKLENKTLALGKNAETDQILSTAEASNTYDSAAASKLTELMTNYRDNLQSIRGATTGPISGQLLDRNLAHAEKLVTQGSSLD